MKKNPWIPIWTLFIKEVHRFFKIPVQALITPPVTALLFLFIFGVSATSNVEGVSFSHFLLPGLIAMTAINGAFFNCAFSILLSKLHGDIEDLKLTPLRPRELLWGMGFASALRGFIAAILVWLVISTILFYREGIFYFPHSFGVFCLLILVLGLTFGWLGFAVGMAIRSFEMLNSWVQFIIIPLTYLGGTFFSISQISPFWQKVMTFNPLFYYISAIRQAFLGFSQMAYTPVIWVFLSFFILAFICAHQAVKRCSFRHL